MARPLDVRLGDLVRDLGSGDWDSTVEQVITSGRSSIGAADAGITLLHGKDRFETIGGTDERVGLVDKLQYELSEGPCVDAAVESRTIWSDDLTTDRRWPRWGPAAADLGFRSILSTELHARGRRVGALNFYAEDLAHFSAQDAEVAHLFAFHAAAALAAARNEVGLVQALDSRLLIGQAQGILMERFDLDANRAFAVLKRLSQDTNIKLRDLAAQLVREGSLPVPVEPID